MFIKFLVLLTVLFSIQGHAQEDEALTEKKSNYQVNDDYKAGNDLIYDCARIAYACVDEDGYNKCNEKRKEAIEKKIEPYPCAPLKKFPTKINCAQKNYEVIESLAKKRFCYPKT
ncbi:MAG: hypothetical protein H7336_00725 [Bacteriovorax sp.]|nr:hypothetical protein [Bacteriovorax sp.]